jgi:hypothetical protein
MMPAFELHTHPEIRNYEYETELDGVVFRLRLKFNSRDSAWYLSIFREGVEVRSGIKVVSDWDILRAWSDTENRPAGSILAVNLGEETSVPGESELGSRLPFVYVGDA